MTAKVIVGLFAPVGEGSGMKRVNQYQFYQIGIAIHPMTELSDGSSYTDAWLRALKRSEP